MPLPSHYTKMGVIGKGPNSEVYRGYDSDLERDVAIKRLDVGSGDASELRREFISRARFLAGTQNPFFIKVLHTDMDPDCPVVVMELANQNFTDAFNCDNPSDNILDCLKALHVIHQSGLRHGNINPRNILFFENRAIKFSDPSVVSETMRSPPSSARYLVPELAAKDRWLETNQLGTQVDIYQLGFCILEKFGGDGFLEHFPGAKLKEVDQEQFWWNWHAGPESFEPIIESVVPRKFQRIRELLRRMLEKDPAKRASSSAELLECFEETRSSVEIKINKDAHHGKNPQKRDLLQHFTLFIRSKKQMTLIVGACFLASVLMLVFFSLYFSYKPIPESTSQLVGDSVSNLSQSTNCPPIGPNPDVGTKLQRLMIDSLPPNASIIVNGKSTGKVTPSAVELDKQSNVIILKLKGLNNVQFNYDFDPKDPKFKTEYRVFKEFNLRPSIRPVDINKIKFDFVEINPNLFDKGAFWMGSTQDEQDEAIKANKSEETLIRSERLHRVTLTRYFSISTVVVNRRTFKEFLADSSYQMESRNFSSQDQDSDDLPAVNISWKDANEFCKWLTKCAPSDLGTFTLPTEAEWEFACRCGTRTPFSFDDKETELKYYANFNDGFSLNRKTSFGIMKSGLLRSNPWGIHDMHGNIWQYCSDRFGYFEKGDETDPVGPSQGSSRVIRGGSFAVNKFMGRSASRNKMDDFVISDETTGFRVVLRPFSGN